MKYINNEKINKFSINEKNTYIVLDFDKTITAYESDDSWDVAGKELSEEFKGQLLKLYKKYRPIEKSYTISIEEKTLAMEKWYFECMELYKKYGLTKEKLDSSIENSNIVFRKGAKEFIQKARRLNIPVIILSAGIGNVIEGFLKSNDCMPNYIISNFIEFDEKGNMVTFDKNKMIHTLNKNIQNNLPKELENNLKERIYKILVGDLVEDENMIPKEEWDTTLKIGFLETNVEENSKVFNKHFDIVLTNEDTNFYVIEKIFI